MRVMTPMTYGFGTTAGSTSATPTVAGAATRCHHVDIARMSSDPLPVGQCLAQDTAGTEHQYQDQHHEGDGILECRIDDSDRQTFHHTEDQPAQHRPADIANAAQYRCSERLETGRIAHIEVDLR